MSNQTTQDLKEFTSRFTHFWSQQPSSKNLYGIPSPCITRTSANEVFWLPQPFQPPQTLEKVEQALDIVIRPEVHQFYTSQFAGDMDASFGNHYFSLIQVWSEDDFIRLQENLIGHLVTQKRLKLSPTLFIATTDSELEIVTVCNLSGKVLLEYFGTKKRDILCKSLPDFLNQSQPSSHNNQ